MACARLAAYAVPDDSVGCRGHTPLYVDGDEIGRVPCLAIARDRRLGTHFLFFCNADWDSLGAMSFDSVELARHRAECIFPGISSRWIDPGITEEEAERYLDELFGEDRCSQCGQRADYVDALIGPPDGTYLCNAYSLEPLPNPRLT